MCASLSFRLNDEAWVLPAQTSPTTTLLDWLRRDAGLTATKEGCAEGDCGACTVAIEAPDGARVPVNACLLTLGQVHGLTLRTVEGLREHGACHPVQTLMAECNATQCGFCTPGIVMTGWSYATEGGDPHEALAGNLCRCTGYRPILEAFQRLPAEERRPQPEAVTTSATLEAPGQVFHRPATLAELLSLRRDQPEAWLLAGGTDLGLRFSEHREHPPAIHCTLGVAELQEIEVSPEGLRIGASLSYRRLLELCEAEPGFTPFATLLRRLGSRQIRALGTLGGNLGTASPIGDALPPLLVLGATLRLASHRGEREMAVKDFLLGYRRNALEPDEVIRNVFLPRPRPDALMACEKLSRRRDQDITAVGLSILLERAEGRITSVRVAHGGLGPQAGRALATEDVLIGAPFRQASFDAAAAALEAEVAPLGDLRGSAEYRRSAAGNLLRRLWWRWSTEAEAQP
ncbi:xanthine dehydrogenase small subunit [Roseomonas elaeocarpi]|uniref:Xanthine dehydrogenase small subunit n=1 Tax=Roseomonas elaeocarpi TaxID=907779 RepID=A0ABV6JW00_9PROT